MDGIAAANWKMNLPPEGIDAYCRRMAEEQGEGLDVVIAPPMPFLTQVRQALGESGALTAAQNCHWEQEGAFTGEVAGAMLKSLGVSAAIVGHSERRTLFGETDEMVARRVAGSLAAGLLTIACLGETLEEREAGATGSVLERQMNAILDACAGAEPELLVIAYEPVWAIGTGRIPEPAQIAEAHATIREMLGGEREEARVLYGGSVKPENAEELARVEGVDGFLVGGASLTSATFIPICDAVRSS